MKITLFYIPWVITLVPTIWICTDEQGRAAGFNWLAWTIQISGKDNL